MKNALIIGNSGGIGSAIEARLLEMGWRVQGLSRRRNGLDFDKPESIPATLDQLHGRFERVIIATGLLAPDRKTPEKSLARLDADQMGKVFQANTLGPAMILKHLPHLLGKQSASQVAVLSARVGSISDNRLGGWYSYRAAKAALNQILRCTAIEMARSHPQSCCVALHPGTVATAFTENYQKSHDTIPAAEAAFRIVRVLDTLTSAQTGQFLDNQGQEISW